MWETSVTTSLTSIRPVSHGSGLDRDAHQDEGGGHGGGRWSGGGGQHHRDGAARMDQTPREVLVRWDGGRRERVTSSALHCNHLFFSFLFFFFVVGRRSTGWPFPPCADGTLRPAKTNSHHRCSRAQRRKSRVPERPPTERSKHGKERFRCHFLLKIKQKAHRSAELPVPTLSRGGAIAR